MFALLRDIPNESFGFSPFELVFADNARGSLHMVRDRFVGSREDSISILSFVGDVKHRLVRCWRLASNRLQQSRAKMKTWYDKRARHQEFQPGDQVLILEPHQKDTRSKPSLVILTALSKGYLTKSSPTPDRRQSQLLCHLNMLLPYYARTTPDDPECDPVPACVSDVSLDEGKYGEEGGDDAGPLPLLSARV